MQDATDFLASPTLVLQSRSADGRNQSLFLEPFAMARRNTPSQARSVHRYAFSVASLHNTTKTASNQTSTYPLAARQPMAGQFSFISVSTPMPIHGQHLSAIDGGFLQFGSNNYDDPSALLSGTDVKCIIVSPGYRLGIFGFLASKGISEDSNFGFWDLRLALEWTYDNIAHFGGNPHNITVGGLSAGAYATFHQLAYDISARASRQIIRRVFQWSNGCGVQPKDILEVQQQYEDLLHVLEIPQCWKASEKAQALRTKSTNELIDAVGKMPQKFFRPISDGCFLSKDLFDDIHTGAFGNRMKEYLEIERKSKRNCILE